MIVARNIGKEYGGFTAVRDVNFRVDPGEVFGLVGPNGAGKTTTLKMLAGLIEPTIGEATIDGRSTTEPGARHRLGFLPEESPLYEEMSARSYLRFFADLYDVPSGVASDRIERTLDRLDLQYRDRPLGDVSKGMKRKVAIARALVNEPDVLVFDEPASGLDPVVTNYVVEFTRDLADEGRTVVFSAHDLPHVERICDRIAIMREGQIIAQGSPAGLRDEYGSTEYTVYTTVKIPGAVRANGQFRRTVDTMTAVESIRKRAQAAGGEIADIRTVDPNLEQVFLDLAASETHPEES